MKRSKVAPCLLLGFALFAVHADAKQQTGPVGHQTSGDSGADSVQILKTSLPQGSSLKRGQPYEFLITLRYNLSSVDQANLGLYLEEFLPTAVGCQEPTHHGHGGTSFHIRRGQGNVDLLVRWSGTTDNSDYEAGYLSPGVSIGSYPWNGRNVKEFGTFPEFCYAIVGRDHAAQENRGHEQSGARPTRAKMVGRWVNDDSETAHITRLEIRSKGEAYLVHAWHRCGGLDCDLREQYVSADVPEEGVLWLVRRSMIPQLDGSSREAEVLWEFRLSGDGRLRLETRHAHFLDASGDWGDDDSGSFSRIKGPSPDAARFEEALAKDPENVEARAKLLHYYFGGQAVPVEEARQARLRHILWLIEHHPDSNLLDGSEATIDPSGHPLADADGYAKVKAAWLEQTEKHKDSAVVLGKAAWFFKMPDKEIAADLLKRAHALEPQAPGWSEGLGLVYATGILGVTMVNQNRFPTGVDPELAKGSVAQKFRGELAKCDDPAVTGAAGYFLAFHGAILASSGKAPPDVFQLAEKYLAGAVAANPGNSSLEVMLSGLYQTLAMRAASPELREAFMKKRLATLEMAAASSDPQQRLDQLSVLVVAAFDAGEMEKAGNYAAESLRLAAAHQEQRGSDMAVHKANIVLGRVALRQNDVEKAKACLLAAGHVHGDPALSSFGPNMSLAKELLERGERDVVLQYLELCKVFWTSSRGQPDRWMEEIKAGKYPEFGANLTY